MKSPPVIVALLLLVSSAFVACKREPPDLTEDQAKTIAEKEFPKWCDTLGNKCSDFIAKGKTKPLQANFEWAWFWISESAQIPMELMVMVDKKGLAAMRLFQAPESGGSAAGGSQAKPAATETAAAPAVAPKAPASLDTTAADMAHEAVAQLARLPGRAKGEGRSWSSIQLNPGIWKRLLGSDPSLKTKGLSSRVTIGGKPADRMLFSNLLAMNELRENHQFQKLLAPYAMGTVRPPSQAEQDKIFAYFPEILAKPFSVTEEGKDPLLIQDAAGALVLDLIGGYPAPPKTAAAAAVAGSTATVTTPLDEPPKPVGPTFKEVFAACETEIGILCLAAPSSVPQARRCLQPHRAALRTTCGRTVGLKRWP